MMNNKPHTHRIVSPGRNQGIFFSESGVQLTPPDDWAFLKAGDAAITRSVKAKGPTWVVMVQKGRRKISMGIWASKAHILDSQEEVAVKRSSPEYARKRVRDLARREAQQKRYVAEFSSEVVSFLNFHPRYSSEAKILGEKISAYAAPVGSGTVARTKRIPISKRAEAAVIAWMRHQTTAYDSMVIARVKGKRREVRRQLAAKSITLLQDYRQGCKLAENCPLKKALVPYS